MTITEANELTTLLHDQMPAAKTLGVSALTADTERVVTTAEWQPEYCGTGGVLHGGYLMSVADGNGATLAFLNLPPGATTTTVESKTNFFRPVSSGPVTATSTMVHLGRTTMVVQTDITNGQDALVSRTLQTQTVRHAPQPNPGVDEVVEFDNATAALPPTSVFDTRAVGRHPVSDALASEAIDQEVLGNHLEGPRW